MPWIKQYTDEQEDFLRQYPSLCRKELAEKFNARFGTSKSVEAIRNHCRRRLGMRMPRLTTFGVNRVPWNKGMKGWHAKGSEKGQAVFISGEMTTNEYTKQDGTKGFQVEVNANILDLIGGKRSENATAAHESYQADPYPPAAYAPQPAPQYQPPPPQGYQTPHQQHQAAVAQHNAQRPPRPNDDIPY